jgi:hypothetical protein
LASSARKVVLLTSVDAPEILWHKGSQWASEQLEADFSWSFQDSGFEVQMIRQASAWQLYQSLHDPNVVAVYWVSHAGRDIPLKEAIGFGAAIPTHDGLDVKSLFQSVGPQLKFLAVIGCSAQSIIDGFKNNGAYTNNPRLKIVSFDRPIQSNQGLTYAMNESIETIADFGKSDYGPGDNEFHGDEWKYNRLPKIVAGYAAQAKDSNSEREPAPYSSNSFTISRTNHSNQAMNEIILTEQGKFLGILPPLAPQSSQTLTIEGRPKRIQIAAHKQNSARDFSGISIQTSDGHSYAPLSVKGHIIGADSQIWVKYSE